MNGLGPHDVVSLGEAYGTVMLLVLALAAFVYMGWATRRHA